MELNLNKFSPQNLKKIRKLLGLVLEELELGVIKKIDGKMSYYEIPLRTLEKEGFCYGEIGRIFKRIDITTINEIIKKKIREKCQGDYELHRKATEISPFFLDMDFRKNLVLSELNIKKIKKVLPLMSKQAKEMVLYLNKVGDLYREPKEKYCYPMMEEKERQKILRYLIDKSKITPKYIQTQIIATGLKKNAQNIRTEIGKINRNVKNNLELRSNLIDSKQSSGYRLNPEFKIILSK